MYALQYNVMNVIISFQWLSNSHFTVMAMHNNNIILVAHMPMILTAIGSGTCYMHCTSQME